MLSEKDNKFILRWEQERDAQRGFTSKLLRGLPMAMLFFLPVLLLVLVVYLFLPEWYYRISNTSSGTFLTVVLAVFLSILFLSYFRMQFKWEMNEQLYQELKAKSKHTSNISETITDQ